MFAAERYRSIVERVSGMGRASVIDLAGDLDVAPETIRRDLSELERQGLVRRVHGGAVAVGTVGFETSVDSRSALLIAEKDRIAAAAIAELPVEGAVIIDAGTTTGRMLGLIPEDHKLTVITDSVAHAMALANHANINTLLLGGRLRPNTLACVDQWTLNALSGLYADLAFVATNGISLDRGLTTPDPAEAAVKQAMLKAAKRKIILADHSKFGEDHFAQFGTVDQADLIISDSGLSIDMAAEYRDAGYELVCA